MVSELTGEKVVASTAKNEHGHCRVSLAGDDERRKYYVHIDVGVVWSGLLYLTLPEHCHGGTEFYRHRASASDRAPIYPDELKAAGVKNYAEAADKIIEEDSNDLSKWEHISTIPMRFNRLVLLRPCSTTPPVPRSETASRTVGWYICSFLRASVRRISPPEVRRLIHAPRC